MHAPWVYRKWTVDLFFYLVIYFLSSLPFHKLDISFFLLSYSTEYQSFCFKSAVGREICVLK